MINSETVLEEGQLAVDLDFFHGNNADKKNQRWQTC